MKLDEKIFQLLLALLIGASFIIGGMNIAFSAVMGVISILAILRGTEPSLTKANLWFLTVCLMYFCFFVWRAFVNNTGGRTIYIFIENIPFLIAPLAIPLLLRLSADKILTWVANWVFPLSLLLLLAAIFENSVLDVNRVMLGARSPLILTVLIVSSINLALFDWKNRASKWKVCVCLSWLIGLVVIGVYAQSRASILGHFFGAAIFISYMIWDNKRNLASNLMRQVFIAICVLLLSIALIGLIYKLNVMPRINYNIDYILSGAEKEMDYSSASRVAMWQLGLSQFWNAPWLGVGPQNTFASIVEQWPYDTRHGHLHSDFLNHLVGGGIIGVGLWVLVVFSPIVFIIFNKVRAQRTIYICLFTVAIIIFSGLTARVFFRPVLIGWAVYMLYFCLLMTENHNRRKSTD